MARKSPGRVVRVLADVMWKRDEMQMRAADALLSAVGAGRERQATRPPRRRASKPKR